MTEKRYRDAGTGEYVTEEYANENPGTTVSETIEMSVEDQADLLQLFGEPDAERTAFRPILFIWREVLKPAREEMTTKPTPQWCNRIISSYTGIDYADMYVFRDQYYGKIAALVEILDEEIATDEECLSYATPEEDVEYNSEHYKNLLVKWQLAILGWELDWDCLDTYAAVEIAAISEIHKMFFVQNGLTQFLENIKFEFTDDDQRNLAAALENLRDGVTSE